MVAASSFGAGFLLGIAWALYASRHVVDFAYVLSWRYFLIVAVETAVATLAFFFAARAGRLGASANAYLLAILAGTVTSTITVGTYRLVPELFYSDAQRVVHVIAIGLLSAMAGWLLPTLFQVKAPNGESTATSTLRKIPFVLYALFAALCVVIAALDFGSTGGHGLVGGLFLFIAAAPWPILLRPLTQQFLDIPAWAFFGVFASGIALNLWLLYLFGWAKAGFRAGA